jgi:hypothetical protein
MEIANYLPGVASREDLITSTSLVTKREWVFTREFRNPACTISLRPFCITRDLKAIGQWDWRLHRAGNTVAPSYLYTGDSDFARSFMVLVNGRTPVCQIDICQADKDELFESFRPAPGDHIIRLLFNTDKKKIRLLHIKALQACIEYFFSFPEVKQLIADIDKLDTLHQELILKSGFRFKERIHHDYSISNLYAFGRHVFHKNLFQ